MRPLLAVALVWCGCRPALYPDARSACSTAQASISEILRGGSPDDLVTVSAGSPRAHALATHALHQRNAVLLLVVMGAGALAGGFIMGFAADPTNGEVRNAGYGLVGGTIGLGVASLGLGAAAGKTRAKAIDALFWYAQTCREQP